MNSFGSFFRVSIFGESHGPNVGITVDGCPPGIPLTEADFEADLGRRQGGNVRGATPRKEADTPRLVSGVFDGHTTGAPLTILFENSNTISSDYSRFLDVPRPGHADFTARKKFRGFTDYRGGGHFSGRITVALVAAGVIAKKIIAPMQVQASILEIAGTQDWTEVLEHAIREGDSLGGIVECVVHQVPAGLGEPFFNSVESVLSHMVFSIPAIKGIEFGAGFDAAYMRGSEHNDCYVSANGKTRTNHAGGIIGGITNGNPLVFRVAVKPTSSIGRPQKTFDFGARKQTILEVPGRHDACITLRMPPVIEAATALVLADLLMLSTVR